MKRIAFVFFLFFNNLSANDQVLKICLTGSTEKTIPNYGEAFVNGARLAISELEGSVRNKVELSVHYYDVTPLAPLNELQKMRDESCDAIIGFSTGNDLLAIEDDLAKKPILSLSIYGDPLARYESTNYLRTAQPNAEVLLTHLLNNLPKKIKKNHRVLVVTASDRSEMLEYKKAVIPLLAKNTKNVTHVTVMEQTHDISELKNIFSKDKKWDFLVLFTRSLIAAKITDEIWSEKFIARPVILGTKYFGSSELPAYLNFLKNKNIEAYFSRQNCMCNKSKEFIGFVKKYESTFSKSPMLISADTYDFVRFLSLTINKIEKLNSQSLLKYYESSIETFIGVGTINIRPHLRIQSKRNFLMKVTGLGYENIE